MSDKTQDFTARTGEISKLDVREAINRRESPRPDSVPEEKPDAGSTTGLIRITQEDLDEMARRKRDTDQPAPTE
jgi:hypothetical protein